MTNKPDFEDIKKILEWKTGRKANGKGIIQTQYGINISDVISNFPGENDIDSFAKMKVSGIGPVYKISLLFFATKGEYPIYDQFADLGLRAIRENAEPQKKKYEYKELTDNFKTKYTQYIEYLDQLSKEYSIEYKGNTDECRKLDRALWVYRHMFKEKEK